MSRWSVASGLAVLLLAGCAPSAPPPPSTPASAPQPAPTVTPAPVPAPTRTPPPPVAVAPGPGPDQCGARDLQYLVGKPRSEIPVPTNPAKRRVACTTCPVTMDFSPERQNIFFDADTGIIKEVKCG